MAGSPSSAVVAMSGGVDSSVAAALLKQAGWDVYGLHFLLPAPAGAAEARIAFVEAVARRLAIPFETLDIREPFERLVIRPFVRAYGRGLTPNPCVACNAAIKFETLAAFALKRGIAAVSTGHYAIVDEGRPGLPRCLRRGKDARKEQSYFLHRLDRRVLELSVFPLGEWSKTAVRRLAEVLGLPAISSPESQEICFVPDNDYRGFVESRKDATIRERGAIVDSEGRVVGEHAGIHCYTIGQRHGLGIASERPYYVKEILPEFNRLVVGRKEDLYSKHVEAVNFNWVEGTPETDELEVLAQIRYRHRAAPGRLRIVSPREVVFDFHEAQWAVTPGQALACYKGDRLLGGGWITK